MVTLFNPLLPCDTFFFQDFKQGQGPSSPLRAVSDSFRPRYGLKAKSQEILDGEGQGIGDYLGRRDPCSFSWQIKQ